MLPSLWLSPVVTLAAMATRSASWAVRVVIATDESEALLESGHPELSNIPTVLSKRVRRDKSVNTFGQFLQFLQLPAGGAPCGLQV